MLHKNKPKRFYIDDAAYFVTVNTQNRRPIFGNKILCGIFRSAMDYLIKRGDFELSAGVLLPDHFHLLILPMKKNISEIMHDLKGYTTKSISEHILLKRQGVEAPPIMNKNNLISHRQGFHALPPSSKRKTISIKIWQRSFYCHVIIDDQDLENHYKYILFNPAKHGYAKVDDNWPYFLDRK